MADEKKASCISPTHTELDDLLDDIIEHFEESEKIKKQETEDKKAGTRHVAEDEGNAC